MNVSFRRTKVRAKKITFLVRAFFFFICICQKVFEIILFQNNLAVTSFGYLFANVCISKIWKLVQDIIALLMQFISEILFWKNKFAVKRKCWLFSCKKEIYKSITGNCLGKLNAKSFTAKDLCKARKNNVPNLYGLCFGISFLK